MANNKIGEVRRSAVIMTFAPGAIMDMRADGAPISAISAGLDEWDDSAPLIGNLKFQKITERRLCKKLGKKYFRLPPTLVDGAKRPGTDKPDESSLVARRFPEWLQCPQCEHIRPASKWANDPGKAYRYCFNCTEKQPGKSKVFTIPVRFATACRAGHIDEFPWNFWLQHKNSCTNKDRLKLSSEGPGLAGLVLSCPDCGQRRTLDGAFRKKALTGLNCLGKRPWLRTNSQKCECNGEDGSYRVVQRGASNLYYPVLESALDIPPWTKKLEKILGDYWETLEDIEDFESRVNYIPTSTALKRAIDRMNITPRQLAEKFEEVKKDLDKLDPSKIRQDEYHLFTLGTKEVDDDFEAYPESVPKGLEKFISAVMRVPRLREVRVLRGFTRITPPFDPDSSEVSPISDSEKDWLPAIEVRGEGIFIQFNISELKNWESKRSVQEHCSPLDEQWKAEWKIRFKEKEPPFNVSPRRLMIHTFSHILIRQLTLECGYSSSSLRERLYVSEPNADHDGMAGLLIYTAAPDSDGTLGGLQRQSAPELFISTVVNAIQSSRWCSSDPLCISGEMIIPDSHSVASCHSCTMAPETSCELHNAFLDRTMLVGIEKAKELGFFENLIED
jgi:hypothetical protein